MTIRYKKAITFDVSCISETEARFPWRKAAKAIDDTACIPDETDILSSNVEARDVVRIRAKHWWAVLRP